MQSPSGTLTAANITKRHAGQLVLRDVTLVVPPGSRIGLVGPNGAGKSTLLRILAGLEEADAGTVRRAPPDLTVGYLPQEPDAGPDETFREYLARRTGVAEAEERLDGLADRLVAEPGAAVDHAVALERFLALGGDDLDARARAVCAELGLSVPLDAPLASLSGGETARARLAAVLLARFDVFLLDEPTNDLDFAGLDRLDRFVRELRGAAVVVSHDRDFLDRTVDRIVELDEWTRSAREFSGGWSDYERARVSAHDQQSAAYRSYEGEKARLQNQLRRMQEWERRGYGQGRKKKKTKDVKKAIGGRIERMEQAEKPYEPWELRLDLTQGRRSGDVVVRLEDAVVERGDFRLGPLDLELSWADRLVILGPNGSGKTTLLDALLGRLPLTAGTRWIGPGVVLGEVAQHRDELARGPLLETFTGAAGTSPETARTLLAKFGLGADDVTRDGASLSPGERMRALVALLAARDVNCLVLDEPTNHLDVPGIEELERALEHFSGPVVRVTHDRRFASAFRATRALELPV
ncbi:MAG TPA: ABC-F family ATP-binding cassette domain-containing protein [Gaiellaceae bacterium]|nr:ABC-F family ATP-binding cassette domain-containing protein [Gaiellaceae bacterium]